MSATGKCEKCGTPTNESFGPQNDLHYFCPDHKDEVFEKVTGRKPKPSMRKADE